MGWIPSREEIEGEASKYNELKFFAKSKNQIVAFILIVSGMSIFLIDRFEYLWVGIVFYLVLAGFVYLNHRWAILIFAIMYSLDKILMISMGARPFSQLLFGAVALIVSYSAFRAATEIKKQSEKKSKD